MTLTEDERAELVESVMDVWREIGERSWSAEDEAERVVDSVIVPLCASRERAAAEKAWDEGNASDSDARASERAEAWDRGHDCCRCICHHPLAELTCVACANPYDRAGEIRND